METNDLKETVPVAEQGEAADDLGEFYRDLGSEFEKLYRPGESPLGFGVMEGDTKCVDMMGLCYYSIPGEEVGPLSFAPMEVQIHALDALPRVLRAYADLTERAIKEFWAKPANREVYGPGRKKE